MDGFCENIYYANGAFVTVVKPIRHYRSNFLPKRSFSSIVFA